MTKTVYAEKRGITWKQLMKYRPTEVGRVGPYRFYEDPELGDEAPLLVVNEGGSHGPQAVDVYVSHFYDLPTFDEVFP